LPVFSHHKSINPIVVVKTKTINLIHLGRNERFVQREKLPRIFIQTIKYQAIVRTVTTAYNRDFFISPVHILPKIDIIDPAQVVFMQSFTPGIVDTQPGGFIRTDDRTFFRIAGMNEDGGVIGRIFFAVDGIGLPHGKNHGHLGRAG
jgi:hypothetical protein